MNKSSRMAVKGAPNSNRRYSQPTFNDRRYAPPPVYTSLSSSDKIRRGSDMVPTAPTSDPLPPSQYDEKLTVVEAKGPRKSRGLKDGGDGPSFDPDHYNPDGSLRTVHRMPNFNDAYAEAGKARYVRHRALLDREKELSVKQIFEDICK